MISIKEHIPKSAKKMPCWIFTQTKYDLVYLTEDEKYFVSINHKMVYSTCLIVMVMKPIL